MPIEVHNARIVAVTACSGRIRARTYGLIAAGIGALAMTNGGGWLFLGWAGALAGLAVALAFWKRPARLVPKIIVDSNGFWCSRLPPGAQIPFAAIACATHEIRVVKTGRNEHEFPMLNVDLKPRAVLAEILPGARLPRCFELDCNGLDVQPDDIVRCIDGYLDELHLKSRKLEEALS